MWFDDLDLRIPEDKQNYHPEENHGLVDLLWWVLCFVVVGGGVVFCSFFWRVSVFFVFFLKFLFFLAFVFKPRLFMFE